MARWKPWFHRLKEWARRSWKLLLGLGAGAAAIVAILTAWDKIVDGDDEPVPKTRNAALVRVNVVPNRTLAQYRREFAAGRTVPKPCKGFKRPDDPQGAGASIPPDWHASVDGVALAQDTTETQPTTTEDTTTEIPPTTTTEPEPKPRPGLRELAEAPEQLVGRETIEPQALAPLAQQVAMDSEQERAEIVAGLQAGGQAAVNAQKKLVEATLGDVITFKVRLIGLVDTCTYTRSLMLDKSQALIGGELPARRDALFYTAANEDDSSTGSLWVPRPRRGKPFHVRLEVFDDRPQLLEERTTAPFPRG